MDVTIVCHTEFGRVVNREVAYTKDAVGGVSVAVPNLIKLADKYNAKVTFAVMPEVVEYFPKNIEHEIGLHVHPGWTEYDKNGEHWCIGDAYLRDHCVQSINSVGLRNYSYEEQLCMIRAGRDRIVDYFGLEPHSFVSGLWSINNDTIKALIKSGFSYDCSTLLRTKPSVYDWSELNRICLPYHPHEEDYQKRGDLPILIVPTSQTLLGENVNPEVAPVLGLGWLKACFKEYYQQNVPLFNICLHSPCMSEPYFIETMDALLSFISKHKVNFKFISEIGDYHDYDVKTSFFPYVLGINAELMRTFVEKRILSRRNTSWNTEHLR